MNTRPPQPPPVAEALHWVSRITSVALMTLLPILGGRWLDERWNTKYWALIGLVVGLVVGFWQLMELAKQAGKRRTTNRNDTPPTADRDSLPPPSA